VMSLDAAVAISVTSMVSESLTTAIRNGRLKRDEIGTTLRRAEFRRNKG